MRHALFLPPFGELADPRRLGELAARADSLGWDGLFLWDHVLRPAHEPQEIADVWVALSAVACATSVLRLGPMVTPTARRRPQKLAREATTLDWLSSGRVTLGLGLGVDTSGELSRFSELVDPVARGDALDEAAELLAALFTGNPIDHEGTYYTAREVTFLPRPLQKPRLPLWLAARGSALRPVRRAARYEGLFAIDIDVDRSLDGLSRMVEAIDATRGSHEGYDIAVTAAPGADFTAWQDAGVTWAMWSFSPGDPVEVIAARIEEGPG